MTEFALIPPAQVIVNNHQGLSAKDRDLSQSFKDFLTLAACENWLLAENFHPISMIGCSSKRAIKTLSSGKHLLSKVHQQPFGSETDQRFTTYIKNTCLG